MAVYTEITDSDVRAFVAEYDLGKVIACKGIAEGIENSNYLLVTETGPYILTLYEKRVKTEDLPFFIGLMDYLAERGVPCPTPVHGCDGQALRQLANRPACIVTFLKGLWPRQPNVAHCAGVGAALAQLHLAGQGFGMWRDNDLSVAGWRPLFEAVVRHPASIAAELVEELSNDLDVLEARWPGDLPVGIIHADLFPDNVFFEGSELSGLIDFYFACNDFLAYDLAVCLNAWCFEGDGSLNITKARRLVASYTSTRPLSAAEREMLPLLAHGAAMRFLLTRLYDWVHTPKEALVTPKNPMEYLKKVRFHRSVRSIGALGLV